jgi:hypothetical protein
MPQYMDTLQRSMADLRESIYVYLSIPSILRHPVLTANCISPCCNQLNLICRRGLIFSPMNHPEPSVSAPAWIGLHYCRLASTTTIAFGVHVGVGSGLAHCYPLSAGQPELALCDSCRWRCIPRRFEKSCWFRLSPRDESTDTTVSKTTWSICASSAWLLRHRLACSQNC